MNMELVGIAALFFAAGGLLGILVCYRALRGKLAQYRAAANDFLYFAGDAKRVFRKYIFEMERVKGGKMPNEEGRYGGKIPWGLAENYIEKLDSAMRKWESVVWEGPEFGGAPRESEVAGGPGK